MPIGALDKKVRKRTVMGVGPMGRTTMSEEEYTAGTLPPEVTRKQIDRWSEHWTRYEQRKERKRGTRR